MKNKILSLALTVFFSTSAFSAVESTLYIGQAAIKTKADLIENQVTENDILEGKNKNFCFTGDQSLALELTKEALSIHSGDYSIASLSIDSNTDKSVIVVKASFYGEDGSHSKNLKINRCE
jgi:hypothetical protein